MFSIQLVLHNYVTFFASFFFVFASAQLGKSIFLLHLLFLLPADASYLCQQEKLQELGKEK
jgi:hypothetical protein